MNGGGREWRCWSPGCSRKVKAIGQRERVQERGLSCEDHPPPNVWAMGMRETLRQTPTTRRKPLLGLTPVGEDGPPVVSADGAADEWVLLRELTSELETHLGKLTSMASADPDEAERLVRRLLRYLDSRKASLKRRCAHNASQEWPDLGPGPATSRSVLGPTP